MSPEREALAIEVLEGRASPDLLTIPEINEILSKTMDLAAEATKYPHKFTNKNNKLH